MNKVLLVGRLIKDAELKQIRDGEKSVLNLTIAVSRNYVNDKGIREADFVPVSCWNRSAGTLVQYLTKGRLVSVTGKINIRKVEDKEGRTRFLTSVVADEIQFLDSKKNTEDTTA